MPIRLSWDPKEYLGSCPAASCVCLGMQASARPPWGTLDCENLVKVGSTPNLSIPHAIQLVNFLKHGQSHSACFLQTSKELQWICFYFFNKIYVLNIMFWYPLFTLCQWNKMFGISLYVKEMLQNVDCFKLKLPLKRPRYIYLIVYIMFNICQSILQVCSFISIKLWVLCCLITEMVLYCLYLCPKWHHLYFLFSVFYCICEKFFLLFQCNLCPFRHVQRMSKYIFV